MRFNLNVATVLTVYGIETALNGARCIPFLQVATVLTVYGIETYQGAYEFDNLRVATVLTVYGIET